MVIRHGQAELADSCLDGVPARQTRGEVYVARQAKVGGVENLVCAGVVEDRLGVDASLVSEGAETGDGVVERSVDLDSLGNHILNLEGSAGPVKDAECVTDLLEHVQLVLALDIVGGAHDHAGKKTAEGRDTVALTN